MSGLAALAGGLPVALLLIWSFRTGVLISAFLYNQTFSARQPARFPRSDTKLPCLSARNIVGVLSKILLVIILSVESARESPTFLIGSRRSANPNGC
jgi:hypothetical protein